MEWSELFNQNNKPNIDNISAFINNELWNDLYMFIKNNYSVLPKIEYSICSMQKGWNIKFKKASKSLCTVYPMEGYFKALVVVGEKELMQTELIMPTCCEYTQHLFREAASSALGRWLMLEVRECAVLQDVISLIQIRVKPN